MQNEMYLLAGSKVGKGGKLEMDMEAFRKAQGMSFQEVSQMAASKLQDMQTHGIFDWNTRKQELKDTIAQKLKPGEQQMLMLQQARAFQAQVPGMTLGTALQKASGGALDENEARALEVQFQSRKYWEGMAQQARQDRRDLVEHERAGREQYRTPGLMTRMGRGVRGALGAVSDTLSSPFRSISEHFERVGEEEEAAGRGEHISRYEGSQIVKSDAERDLLRESIQGGGLRRSYEKTGTNIVTETGTGGFTGALGRSAGRQVNRIGSFLGLSATSDANKLAAIADYSKGRYTSVGETFGDPEEAMKRVQDVINVSRAVSAPAITGTQYTETFKRIEDAAGPGSPKVNAMDIIARATSSMMRSMGSGEAGLIKSARAMSESELKDHFIKAATTGPNKMTEAQANNAWKTSGPQIMKQMGDAVYASGDQKSIERFEKAKDVEMRAGGVDLKSEHDAAKDQIADELHMAGLEGISDKGLSEVKALVADNKGEEGAAVIAIAAAQRGLKSKDKRIREASERTMGEVRTKYGDKAGELQERAMRVHLSDETADKLTETLGSTQDLAGMTSTVKLMRTGLGHQMELAARDEFSKKLAQQTGRKELEGMGTDKALGSLSPGEVKMLDPKLREAVEKFKATGDRSLVDREIEKSAATSEKVRHGGGSSEKIKEADERIAQLDEEAQKAAEQGEDPVETQKRSVDKFAAAIDKFEATINTHKGGAEAADLAQNMPWLAALRGGG
jgi:hypothetical protein